MNKNFRDLLNERLKDEDFKKEFTAINADTDVSKSVFECKKAKQYDTKGIIRKIRCRSI